MPPDQTAIVLVSNMKGVFGLEDIRNTIIGTGAVHVLILQ